MESNRVNLDEHKGTYLSLTFVLIILSIVGIVLLFQIIKTRSAATVVDDQTVSSIPTSTPALLPSVTLKPTVVMSPVASVTAKLSPTLKPTSTPKPTLTPKPTITPKPTVTPKPTIVSGLTPTPTEVVNQADGLLNYSSQEDKFSVSYQSSRKVYADKETSGDRFTFTNILGNFAIHVGFNDKWAWVNYDRKFTNNLLVAGMPTFRYDITSQTIVDLQFDGKNYTIQCIHNGREDLKSECEAFIASFQLLK